MIRRIFTMFSALSLLLCLAAMAMWVRSYSTPDAFVWQRAVPPTFEFWSVWSERGRIGLEGRKGVPPGGNGLLSSGFSWFSGPTFRVPMGYQREASEPYWHLVVYTGVLPCWWLLRVYTPYAVRTRRRKLGLCLICGYDLRAHAPGTRCPECGAFVPADQAAEISR